MVRKGAVEMDTLVTIILGLAFLVIAIGIIYTVFTPSYADFSEFSCWTTNSIKASNLFFKKFLPSSCSMIEIEKPVDVQGLTELLRKTWWMYGQGENDFGWSDNEITVYSFTFAGTENSPYITYSNLLNYLLRHNLGDAVKDIKDSDYNYLQKGSEKQTLCYGNKIGGTSLNKNERYFIIFIDDSGLGDLGDKIAITKTPNLKQESMVICPSIVEDTAIVIKEGLEIEEIPTK